LGLFPFLSDAEEPRDPHNCISIVSFANKRAVGGAFYDYTARYGAVREEDRITLRQSMFPEMINDLKSQTRISLEAPSTDYELFEYLVEKMGLRNLLDLPRIALSNGQTRRARILKALLAKPRLLLLDEPLSEHSRSLEHARILSSISQLAWISKTARQCRRFSMNSTWRAIRISSSGSGCKTRSRTGSPTLPS
jgi:hypothetical protein